MKASTSATDYQSFEKYSKVRRFEMLTYLNVDILSNNTLDFYAFRFYKGDRVHYFKFLVNTSDINYQTIKTYCNQALCASPFSGSFISCVL